MGREDYASTGGALKLKGAKDAGISKKKKKKRAANAQDASNRAENEANIQVRSGSHEEDAPLTGGDDGDKQRSARGSAEPTRTTPPVSTESAATLSGKTEAERKFEEMRRKRVSPTSQEVYAWYPYASRF